MGEKFQQAKSITKRRQRRELLWWCIAYLLKVSPEIGAPRLL